VEILSRVPVGLNAYLGPIWMYPVMEELFAATHNTAIPAYSNAGCTITCGHGSIWDAGHGALLSDFDARRADQHCPAAVRQHARSYAHSPSAGKAASREWRTT